MSDAITIHHRFKRAGSLGLPHLVPMMTRPIQAKDRNGRNLYRDCPTCHRYHPVKTIHLWLDEKGECLVSPGVLADLKEAGMPDLTIVGHDAKPPAIEINKNRSLVDRNNRAIRPLTEMKVRAI